MPARKPAVDNPLVAEAQRLRDEGCTIEGIAARLRVSMSTIGYWVRHGFLRVRPPIHYSKTTRPKVLCTICGVHVYPPCKVCQVRSIARGLSFADTADDLRLQLEGAEAKRLEELRQRQFPTIPTEESCENE